MKNTKIEWAHHTFNPWRGCTKVSAGCANCYAETLSGRNPKTLGVWGPNGTRVVAAESAWREPLKWDREAAADGERRRVFCASLADVFEDWRGPMVDADGSQLFWPHNSWQERRRWIGEPDCGGGEKPVTMDHVRDRLFRLIDSTPSLDWLLLTKRPANVLGMTYDAWCKPVPGHATQNAGDGRHWAFPPNVWLGTSVEDQAAADDRIPHLLRVPAAVRFLSMEPLLGATRLDCLRISEDIASYNALEGCGVSRRSMAQSFPNCRGNKIDWVIVGGESGSDARPMSPAWARSLRDQCAAADVPFFFKQWGEWGIGGADAVCFGDDGTFCATSGNLVCVSTDRNHTHSLLTRMGKKTAGRLLDGREHSGIPTKSLNERDK